MSFSNLQKHLIRTGAFALKNWLITKKRVFHLFEILFWPLINLISVGLLTQFLGLESRMIEFVLIGVIAFSVIQIGQLDMAYVILYSIWNKSLKHEMAAPVNVFHFVGGSWIMGVIHSIMVFLLLCIFSSLAFHLHFLDAGIGRLVLFFLGLTYFSASVGMAVCALAFRFGGRAHVGATFIVSVLVLVSGIYYPVEILPKALRFVAYLIPLTYFLEYFRSFYGFASKGENLLLSGFLLTTVYNVAAGYLLCLSIRNARQKGILTKMSE
jgi:ABC-2 type transport system permease protein